MAKHRCVGIIDYGCGNLRSVFNAFNYLGEECRIVDAAMEIKQCSHLVLPGVGSFNRGMKVLRDRNIDSVLKEKVRMGIPLLGICLGMQLLGSRGSEDGECKGLALIDGDVDLLQINHENRSLKVPHVGFNTVEVTRACKLFNGFSRTADFYFTHSFRMRCSDANKSVGLTWHGEKFVSALEHENIFGTQFHPEKSQVNGIRLLENFVNS